MAPKPRNHFKTLSPTAQIDRLHQRAAALQAKHDCKELCSLIRSNPEHVPTMRTCLDNLIGGARRADEPRTPAKREPSTPGSVQHVSTTPSAQNDYDTLDIDDSQRVIMDCDENGDGDSQLMSAPRAKVRKTGVQDPIESHWLPHTYTKLANTSPQQLKMLMTDLGPIVLSPFNLNSATRTGSKEAKQEMLCDVLEFLCGVDTGSLLVGDLRHLPTLNKALAEQMQSVGDRLRGLRLPPGWSAHGVYKLEKETRTGKTFVLHRFSQIRHPLGDVSFAGQDGKTISFDELHVSHNFSDSGAKLGASGTLQQIDVVQLGNFWHDRKIVSGLASSRRLDSQGRSPSVASVPLTSNASEVGGSTRVARSSVSASSAEAAAVLGGSQWSPPVPTASAEDVAGTTTEDLLGDEEEELDLRHLSEGVV